MNAKPQILVLLGSPRKDRNSETLADSFLEPLREAGCTVTKVHVSELNIHHCTGCEACQESGTCVLRDDMTAMYETLDRSDWIVLVSPTYFNSISGILKILIDRCQVYWARKFVLKRPPIKMGRRGFLLMSAGIRQTPENLSGSKRVADFFFKAQDIGFSDSDMLCLDRTDRADEAHFLAAYSEAAELAKRSLEKYTV